MLSCGCRFDEDPADDDDLDDDFDDFPEDVGIDGNGCLTELHRLEEQAVVVHYDDVPETDITTLNGIRCTTALRTAIDLAPELERSHLEEIVRDCLERGLFTLDEAERRIEQPDISARPAAALMREVLRLHRG
jgi:hypothetical protein